MNYRHIIREQKRYGKYRFYMSRVWLRSCLLINSSKYYLFDLDAIKR